MDSSGSFGLRTVLLLFVPCYALLVCVTACESATISSSAALSELDAKRVHRDNLKKSSRYTGAIVANSILRSTIKGAPPSAAAALQSLLNAAILRGDTEFAIAPGAYNFSSANFEIAGASNMRITAEGVDLIFSGTGRRMPGVNISNCDTISVSGPLSIDYYGLGPSRRGQPGITYNLLNSTNVVSEDITIYQAPFFSVTAFNGGGGHVFRRFRLPSNHTAGAGGGGGRYPHQRDAFHFTDLRRGVVLEDSDAHGFGDDFFNSHNTLMIVLRRESPTSLLLINPHLQNVAYGRNTVYGTNCVLENIRRGDTMRFFAYPGDMIDCEASPLGSGASMAAGSPVRVDDAATLADAALLAKYMQGTFSTVAFDASDVWRVQLQSAVASDVNRAALVNLDAFSTPGTVIRNNRFNVSRYNIGRFKSNGGRIINNTFTRAGANLEITPLPWYFEGNLPRVHDVIISGNTFIGEGPDPIHCGPYCGQTRPPKNSTCAVCGVCATDSPWAANITVADNKYL